MRKDKIALRNSNLGDISQTRKKEVIKTNDKTI